MVCLLLSGFVIDAGVRAAQERVAASAAKQD
jgi:hypothetical protein